MIDLRAEDAAPGIDLTPVIDMVFLLLIFFLVATTFHQTEREMEVALPVARSGGPITAQLREIVVNVAADGSVVVSGRTVSIEELEALIRGALEQNGERKVSVRGDARAAYQSVVAALDACRRAGVEEPWLDTLPAPGSP